MPDLVSSLLYCSRCKRGVASDILNSGNWGTCYFCRAELYAVVFPALIKPVQNGSTGETLLSESEASCFYHPQKRAATTCEYCGRFLCSLCEIDWNGKFFCPPCIEAGKTKGRMKNLDNRRVLYDNFALSMAVLPVFFLFTIYFTFLTAPIALYISFRYWNAPSSIIPRTKIRFVLAILFASVQILGWMVGIYFLFRRWI
jgi:hypothetical protein